MRKCYKCMEHREVSFFTNTSRLCSICKENPPKTKSHNPAEYHPSGLKSCTQCGQTQVFSNFIRSDQSIDGLTYYCKVCIKENNKKHADKRRATKREKDLRGYIGPIGVELYTTGYKECNTCNKNLVLSSFARNRNGPGLLSRICKACYNTSRKNAEVKEGPKYDEYYIRGIKKCSSCKKELTLDFFGKDKRGPGGLSRYCKTCVSIRDRNRDKEKNRKKSLDSYYKEHERNKVKANGRKIGRAHV